VDEHSLHSPFLFDLYTNVIEKETDGILQIENLRSKLLKDERSITLNDLGVGSKHASGATRKISEIADVSLSDVRFSSLYFRLASHFKARNIVELGTSFGINTLYLAQVEGSTVYTFEGANEVADIAELSFEFASAKNVKLIRGNIDTTLFSWLSRMPKIDLAFMDANHRYESTLKYFNHILMKSHHKSVVIIDDIHDSPEMERAWSTIKEHDLVYLTLDLLRCGIAFLDPSLAKQHVVLHF
jgi:predicted O-methyltransferase YrrM